MPPSSRILILPASRSRHSTSFPKSARQAPLTSPTYPVPTTVIFKLPSRLVLWMTGAQALLPVTHSHSPWPSRGQIKFFAAPRRIGFPAAAGRTVPIELARLEAAILTAVTRDALRVAVHQVLHQLHVAAAFGPDHQQLGIEQPVQTA